MAPTWLGCDWISTYLCSRRARERVWVSSEFLSFWSFGSLSVPFFLFHVAFIKIMVYLLALSITTWGELYLILGNMVRKSDMENLRMCFHVLRLLILLWSSNIFLSYLLSDLSSTFVLLAMFPDNIFLTIIICVHFFLPVLDMPYCLYLLNLPRNSYTLIKRRYPLDLRFRMMYVIERPPLL